MCEDFYHSTFFSPKITSYSRIWTRICTERDGFSRKARTRTEKAPDRKNGTDYACRTRTRCPLGANCFAALSDASRCQRRDPVVRHAALRPFIRIGVGRTGRPPKPPSVHWGSSRIQLMNANVRGEFLCSPSSGRDHALAPSFDISFPRKELQLGANESKGK